MSNTARDMRKEIEQLALDTAYATQRRKFSERVLAAMETVPRHLFVPEKQKKLAYRNSPLPIGNGQTISQPYMVALMTDLLDTQPWQRILEIGTGCGYQAAILAGLVKEVYSIEIIPELSQLTQQRLKNLGINNVFCKIDDGYQGWPEHAPFDGIIVTAACPHIPEALLEQLAVGGKLVIPVEDDGFHQTLQLVEKTDLHAFKSKQTIAVRFVPLTGEMQQKN